MLRSQRGGIGIQKFIRTWEKADLGCFPEFDRRNCGKESLGGAYKCVAALS